MQAPDYTRLNEQEARREALGVASGLGLTDATTLLEAAEKIRAYIEEGLVEPTAETEDEPAAEVVG